MEKIRIQKIIADSGYCSRRKAEELITRGVVTVNGRAVSLGDKADPANDLIRVGDDEISAAPAKKDNTVNGITVTPVKRESAPVKKTFKQGPKQPDLFGGF